MVRTISRSSSSCSRRRRSSGSSARLTAANQNERSTQPYDLNRDGGCVRSRRLEGKVAIVTGAGSRGEGIGNGRAASILLAREGARVTLVDREASWAGRTLALIEEEGGEAQATIADVTDPDGCRLAVEAAVGRWQGLDVLVNNVGGTGAEGTALGVDLAEWGRGLRADVTS